MNNDKNRNQKLTGEFGDSVVISGGNWTSQLADALENPGVFEIIVPNEALRQLALDAYDEMGIEREIVVTVQEVDVWAELFGNSGGIDE